MTVNFNDLLNIQTQFELAQVDLEVLAKERNELIAEAYAAGYGQREMARLLGLSQPTVQEAIRRAASELIARQPRGNSPRALKAARTRRRAIHRGRRKAKDAAVKAAHPQDTPGLGPVVD